MLRAGRVRIAELIFFISGESAVEALWNAEDDYENAINSFDKAFQWESSEIISKTGELAPIHASLTDVRNPDRTLSLGQLLDEIDTPKCHLVMPNELKRGKKSILAGQMRCLPRRLKSMLLFFKFRVEGTPRRSGVKKIFQKTSISVFEGIVQSPKHTFEVGFFFAF